MAQQKTLVRRCLLIIGMAMAITMTGVLAAAPAANAAGNSTVLRNTVVSPHVLAGYGYKIELTTTGLCLSSDYKNVYTVPCSTASYWQVSAVGGGDNPVFTLQAYNTRLCLSNFNYNVTYPAPCDSTNPGQFWSVQPTFPSPLENLGVQRYLASDWSQGVYFINYNPGETWVFFYP